MSLKRLFIFNNVITDRSMALKNVYYYQESIPGPLYQGKFAKSLVCRK